jgi:hypothetical protein
MQAEPIVADQKEEAITRLALTLAVLDGIIALFTLVIPLLILGEKAWTARIVQFIVPWAGGMLVTALWFVWRVRKIRMN